MCGRYRLTLADELGKNFNIEGWSEIRIKFRLPRFNVAPTQEMPVVRLDVAGKRELAALRWGLVPYWAKDATIGHRMINARAETVAEKPAFRDAFRQRRCLIPSDGFYEWRADGRRKQPWLVGLRSSDLFAFAGLWDRWRGRDGEALETFTVIVTDANDLLKPIHDRMPVILGPADYATWLDVGYFDRTRLEALLRPYPAADMTAYPVSARVNSPENDDELCSAPLEEAG